MYKLKLGKLNVQLDLHQKFDDEIVVNGIQWLPIMKQHCWHLKQLPFLHRDPFDRMLIAQAQVEGLTVLTSDPHIRQYPVATLW